MGTSSVSLVAPPPTPICFLKILRYNREMFCTIVPTNEPTIYILGFSIISDDAVTVCMFFFFRHHIFLTVYGISSTEERQGSFLRREKCTKLSEYFRKNVQNYLSNSGEMYKTIWVLFMAEFRYPIREFPSKPTFDNLMSVLCFKDQALLRTRFSCFIMATCLKRKICTAHRCYFYSFAHKKAGYFVCTGYFVLDSQKQCTHNTDVAAAAAVVLLNVA